MLRLLRVGSEGEITIAKVDIAALLALVAALISGVGDVVRQRSAQEVTDATMAACEEAGAAASEKAGAAVSRLPVTPLKTASPVLSGVPSKA